MKRQSVHFLWDEPQITRSFSSAVSLHSHTDRSREGLSSVRKYARDSAVIGLAAARISSVFRKHTGKDLDFQQAYFAPPLAPAEAYRLEALQIEAMGMSPIVSITDHDTVEGPQQLRSFIDPDVLPVSLEWTVPFGQGFFHVGVHNLPADRADETVDALYEVQCSYCKASGTSCVGSHDARCLPNICEWFEYLSSIPETLLVLNHPLWDVGQMGDSARDNLLSAFLSRYGKWIHALELNGLRSWTENREVMVLAERWKLPVISGGDRHGCEPNGVINLTAAGTFSEFAQEVRSDGKSVVVFLRQYQRPLLLRKLQVVWDVLRNSEDSTGERRRWTDRIFVPWIDGRVLPLSSAEWSNAFSNEPVERPESAECLPSDAVQGTEY